jgi:hypothetical protein
MMDETPLLCAVSKLIGESVRTTGAEKTLDARAAASG